MAIANTKPEITLPRRTATKIHAFRLKVWKVALAESLLAAGLGLLVSYLTVLVLDRFFDTSNWLRIAILLIGAFGLSIWVPWVGLRLVRTRRRQEHIARLLKNQFPLLSDRLLGIIELVRTPPARSSSGALLRAAIRQVDEEVAAVDISAAAPRLLAGRWIMRFSVPLVFALVAAIAIPNASTNAFSRWLTPWRDIDRFTFAQLNHLPDTLIVPISEPVKLEAQLTAHSIWKPASGVVSVNRRRVRTERHEQEYRFDIPPLHVETPMRVAVGDARKTVVALPTERPQLSSLEATVRLPSYLKRSEPVILDVADGMLTVTRGSRIQFCGQATRTLTSACIDGQPVEIDGASFRTSLIDSRSTRSFAFRWRDRLGLAASPMDVMTRIIEDAPPKLACHHSNETLVILETDVLTFDATAKDDYGIKWIGMEWHGESVDGESAILGERIVVGGNPTTSELEATVVFAPQRENIQPQPVRLKLFVEDYLPGRDRIYAQPFAVLVLSEEEHAAWLADQLDKWFNRLLGAYERETQLFGENQSLGLKSIDRLNHPTARKLIASQASAENAQALLLGELHALGESHLKKAVRNTLFDATSLNGIAEMLQVLKDVAGNRMPLVADVLGAAADAPDTSSKTREYMDEAVTRQEELLAQFQAAIEELQKVMINLEGSSFVHRFKVMSRHQMKLAQDIGTTSVASFGAVLDSVKPATRARAKLLAQRELGFLDVLDHLQKDLQAFVNLTGKQRFQAVLRQTKSADVHRQFKEIADTISQHEPGNSITHAELLADTFDRWAEQLVANEKGFDKEPERTKDSLPPAIVLEVMRILAAEIDLREETRSVELARNGVAKNEFSAQAASLTLSQEEVADRTEIVAEKVIALPDSSNNFKKEIEQLQSAATAMWNAVEALSLPDTGEDANAAQTEAIELLMQTAQRQNRGAGSNAGEGVQDGDALGLVTLALMGRSSDKESTPTRRETSKATGKSGRELPEEFRSGVDRYFEMLERRN